MHPLLPLRRALLAFAGGAVLANAFAASGGDDRRELRSGWYLWDPYQFESNAGGVRTLTGLDVQLVPAILEKAGYDVHLEKVDWDVHQQDVRTGARDVAAGAFRTPEREAYAYFTDPYRTETDVLIVPRGRAESYDFRSVPEMLREFVRLKFRLGIVRGFYYGPEIDAFLKDPANAPLIHYATSDNTNLVRLVKGEIDGFLADRIVAATIAWRDGLQRFEEEYPLVVFSAGIHVMFSKKTCDEQTVAAFNQALRELKKSGSYDRISRHYGMPVLLGITLHEPWFFTLDLIGTIAFAVSGVLLARRERYDVFGALVLAALPAAGGGVLRDLLSGRDPIGVLRTPVYLYAILGTVAAGTIYYKIRDAWVARHASRETPETSRLRLPENVHQFSDAVGLAAFTVIGAVIAVDQQCEPLWLWGPILAAATGAGGGIIRDIVRADSNNPSLKGSFYPEVALIWGFVFSLFLAWEASRLNLREVTWGVILTLAGTLGTRLFVMSRGIQSPFLYDRKRHSPESRLDEIERSQADWLRLQLGLVAETPSGGLREASLNASLAWGAAIADRLAAAASDHLPESLSRRILHLQRSQSRLADMQSDLTVFLETDRLLHERDPAATMLQPLREVLVIWLTLLDDILRSPTDSGGRAELRQLLDGRKETLLTRQAGRHEHLALQAAAAFERIASGISALLAPSPANG